MERRVERKLWRKRAVFGLLAIALLAAACGPQLPRHQIDLGWGRTATCYTVTGGVTQETCYLSPQTREQTTNYPAELPLPNLGDFVNAFPLVDRWGCAVAAANLEINRDVLESPGDGTSRIANLLPPLTIPLDNPACATRADVQPTSLPRQVPATQEINQPEKRFDLTRYWPIGALLLAGLAISLRRGTAPTASGGYTATNDWGIPEESGPKREVTREFTALPITAHREARRPTLSVNRVTGQSQFFVPAHDWLPPTAEPARVRAAGFAHKRAIERNFPSAPSSWKNSASIHEQAHIDAALRQGRSARPGTHHKAVPDGRGGLKPGQPVNPAMQHTFGEGPSAAVGDWQISVAPLTTGGELSAGDRANAREAMDEAISAARSRLAAENGRK